MIFCHHNTDTLDMCMKKYYFGKIFFFTNLQLCELRQFLCIVFNMGSMVVPIRADQLLPQFLLEPFDSLPPQYRHAGHVHEEILFWKNIFLKICSFVNLHCMKRPISEFLLIYANVSRIPLVIFVSNLLNSAHKWKYRLSLSFLFRLLKHL